MIGDRLFRSRLHVPGTARPPRVRTTSARLRHRACRRVPFRRLGGERRRSSPRPGATHAGMTSPSLARRPRSIRNGRSARGAAPCRARVESRESDRRGGSTPVTPGAAYGLGRSRPEHRPVGLSHTPRVATRRALLPRTAPLRTACYARRSGRSPSGEYAQVLNRLLVVGGSFPRLAAPIETQHLHFNRGLS